MNNFDAKGFEDIQKVGKDNMEASVQAFGVVQKKAQVIATEFADYSKKAFETSTAAFEKLAGAKSPETVMEVQQKYLKDAYEGFVAQATKMSELYADLAKEAYKPYEAAFAKVAPAKF